MASTPRAAALREAPRRAARIVAIVNHSRLWSALIEADFMAASSGLGGSAEIRRDTARSASTTPSVARRIHDSTSRQYAHGAAASDQRSNTTRPVGHRHDMSGLSPLTLA